ncbi:hypothetical protein IJG22_00960 [Candidatus Saccharibacteria bacterium]|nr:hypothetical protein [Candidatus Saccharibacteria bacterium]
MRKTHKKILGLFGLVFVVAMTVVAAFLPAPKTSALSTLTDTITVVVVNPEEPPSATINSPDSGDKFLTPEHEIEIGYTNIKDYRIVVIYTDENGVEHGPETVVVENNPGEVGPASHSFRPIAEQFGYGKYVIRLEATGDDDALIEDAIEFEYVAIEADTSTDEETGNTYVDLDFDQDQDSLTEELKIDKVVITIYNKDGNPVENMPPIVVQPPVERVEIPFGDYDIPEGDYILVAQPFNSAGEALFDTVTMTVKYDGGAIVVPSTADTGGLFKNLNISRADYLITGIGIFLMVSIGSIVFMRRHNRTSKRRK